MKEYSVKFAHEFSWSPSYEYMLKDAITRTIPPGNKTWRVLDVGCGHGDWASTLTEKGYQYTGTDLSSAMLKIARSKNPGHTFVRWDAHDMLKFTPKNFHLIVCIMIYPSFQKPTAIERSLKTLSQLLTQNGSIIVAVPHPCFDPYIQKGLMARSDVQTNFVSYYAAGARYKIFHPGASQPFVDYHQTLKTYFTAAHKSGLFISDVDECKISKKAAKADPSFYKRKALHPSYLLMTYKKR